MIPANLYVYFQYFNTDKTANGMEHFRNSIDKKDGMSIHLDKIDTFFTTVSDLYTTIIENGLLAIDYEHVRFESTHTTMFFTTGLKCIEHAATMPNIDIILEFLLLEYQDHAVSFHELFEMTLLKNIIPLLARQDRKSVQTYLEIAGQFSSHTIRDDIFKKFDKYLQDQTYLF